MLYLGVMGWTEWLLIILAVLVLFGARKIPELARSMGSSVNEFKKGLKEGAEPPKGDKERER